jgi:pyridoxamine 5'-phosphate oxidase family protein
VSFTKAQLDYLAGQMLGRLATIRPDGTPQNNPVTFVYNAGAGTIDIGGYRMGATRKYRNVAANPAVAFVVDDVVSTDPFLARFVEIRGRAQALSDQPPPLPGMTGDIIRIHPDRVISSGLDGDG